MGDRVGEEIGRERSGKSLQRAGTGLIYSSLRTSIRGGSRSKSGSKSRNRNRRTYGAGLRLANIWRCKGGRVLWVKKRVLRVKKRVL